MTTTTFQGTPCPHCRATDKLFLKEKKVCASCRRAESDTETSEEYPRRDANGSLLCQTCKDPFPYADTDGDGKFHCYGCRLEKQLKAENGPKIVTPKVVTTESTGVSVKVNIGTNDTASASMMGNAIRSYFSARF